MPRFFLPEGETPFPAGGERRLRLTGEDAFHLRRVLRAREGEEVVVCSASGTEYSCRIAFFEETKKEVSVVLSVCGEKPTENEPPCLVRVFQGVPKGKKTDAILQKCTELGAGEIHLVYLDRSVPQEDGESAEKKEKRFQKICDQAAQQSQRGRLVPVFFHSSLQASLPEIKKSDVAFACYEGEREKSLKELLHRAASSVSLLIGPEGGLSAEEVALCRENGIAPVTLGRRILRTETAAAAVLAMILYEKEL